MRPTPLSRVGDADDIQGVLTRVCKAQPEIYLQNHEGYYRHSDIAALIRALCDSLNLNTEDTGEWSTDPTKP